MGVAAGPKVVTEGLVFSLDVGNVFKSTDSTVNNFLQNGSFAGGLGVTYEGESNPTNTIVELKNPGDSNYVLRQNGSNTEYQMNIDGGAQGTLSANTQYVMSGWYAKSPDYNGGDTMFHARAFSSSGAHISTGNGIGTLLYSIEVGGLTWEYRYQTISTPVDYSGDFDWYMGYGTTNTTGYRYYTGLKVEEGSFPSLVDLSRNGNDANLINGVGYNSGNLGSLVFDGVNDYSLISLNNPGGDWVHSIEFWMNMNQNQSAISIRQDPFQIGTPSISRYSAVDISNNNFNWYFYSNDCRVTTNLFVANTWYHIGLTYAGGGATSTNKQLYVNGVNVPFNTSGSANLNIPANSTLSIGRDHGRTTAHFNGKISNFKIYNRALTPQEIQQNFNALRGRFGI